MRLAASVPGGMVGKYAFSVSPNHQRSSAPSPPPTAMARIPFHMPQAFYLTVGAGRNGSSMLPPGGTTMRPTLAPALSPATVLAPLAACSQQSQQNAADERLRS